MVRRLAAVLALALVTGMPASTLAADEGAAKALAGNPAAAAAADPLKGWTRVTRPVAPANRPAALPVLYLTLALAQGADIYTTTAGLERGATEANPIVAHTSGNPSAMIALKVASTAATIGFAERMWKKNRVAAIALMLGVNGATAAVAVHNARVIRATR